MEIFTLTDEAKEEIKKIELERYIGRFKAGVYPNTSESLYKKLLNTSYENLNSVEECLVPCCDGCKVQMAHNKGFQIVGEDYDQILYYCKECVKEKLIELDELNKED